MGTLRGLCPEAVCRLCRKPCLCDGVSYVGVGALVPRVYPCCPSWGSYAPFALAAGHGAVRHIRAGAVRQPVLLRLLGGRDQCWHCLRSADAELGVRAGVGMRQRPKGPYAAGRGRPCAGACGHGDYCHPGKPGGAGHIAGGPGLGPGQRACSGRLHRGAAADGPVRPLRQPVFGGNRHAVGGSAL